MYDQLKLDPNSDPLGRQGKRGLSVGEAEYNEEPDDKYDDDEYDDDEYADDEYADEFFDEFLNDIRL